MRHEIIIKENSSVDELIRNLRTLQAIHNNKKLIISSVYDGDIIIEEENKNDETFSYKKAWEEYKETDYYKNLMKNLTERK